MYKDVINVNKHGMHNEKCKLKTLIIYKPEWMNEWIMVVHLKANYCSSTNSFITHYKTESNLHRQFLIKLYILISKWNAFLQQMSFITKTKDTNYSKYNN